MAKVLQTMSKTKSRCTLLAERTPYKHSVCISGTSFLIRLAVLPSLPTLPSNQAVDHCQAALSKVVILLDLQSCSGADDVYQ